MPMPMPLLNFGGNKNKYCNLSDMNFFIINMKNIKNRYSDPDPLFPNVDPDPDLCLNEMDPKSCFRGYLSAMPKSFEI